MTSIEWTDKTWNPTRGCSLASPGCTNCYAMRQAHRFSGKGRAYEGLTVLRNKGPVWTGEVRYAPEVITAPLRWKTQCRVFVNSMSDLFHEKLEDDVIDTVFAVMAICHMHETLPSHTFQILTKRAQRMRDYMRGLSIGEARRRLASVGGALMEDGDGWADQLAHRMPWPLPNVWLGVSVENQEYAAERLPLLLETPAAVKFVSYEPALGPVDFSPFLAIDWLIVGGESGPKARPFDVAWARSVIAQCKAAGVACFVKQLGGHAIDTLWWADFRRELKSAKGGDMSEWPEDLRVREWPEVQP